MKGPQPAPPVDAALAIRYFRTASKGSRLSPKRSRPLPRLESLGRRRGPIGNVVGKVGTGDGTVAGVKDDYNSATWMGCA